MTVSGIIDADAITAQGPQQDTSGHGDDRSRVAVRRCDFAAAAIMAVAVIALARSPLLADAAEET